MNFNGTFTQVIADLVEQVMPSLVVVRGRRFGAGSGIVWDSNGLILTNNHVVGRHTPIVMLQDDGEYESKLVARDPDVDLALLSIDVTGLTPLKPAPVSPRVGEMVFDTRGMVVEKKRDALFRHWMLGFGSGDIVVNTAGTNTRQFQMPNVLRIDYRLALIHTMLQEREVIKGV